MKKFYTDGSRINGKEDLILLIITIKTVLKFSGLFFCTDIQL